MRRIIAGFREIRPARLYLPLQGMMVSGMRIFRNDTIETVMKSINYVGLPYYKIVFITYRKKILTDQVWFCAAILEQTILVIIKTFFLYYLIP